jgi:nitrogen fixation/metabolism regulation signal transduction histidine kinase
VGAAGFGLWLARRPVKSVLTTEGAKSIPAGHYDARVIVKTHDEIGVLPHAFNQMADALEENHGTLQREVTACSQAQDSLAPANNAVEQCGAERTAQLIVEIGERTQAQEIIRERESQLNAYFNSFPAGMAIIDSQFRHLKINQHLADMHGLAVVETVGKTFREIMPQLAPILEAVFQEVYTTGKPILNFELSGETASSQGGSGTGKLLFSPSTERRQSSRWSAQW